MMVVNAEPQPPGRCLLVNRGFYDHGLLSQRGGFDMNKERERWVLDVPDMSVTST